MFQCFLVTYEKNLVPISLGNFKFFFKLMGHLLSRPSRKMSEVDVDINRDYFEVAEGNGFFLSDKYIPEEILTLILSCVDPKDLAFTCRRVCKAWCNIIDRDVWKIKCARKKINFGNSIVLPWFIYFWIYTKEFLNKNLIKNGCGQDNLEHWEILSNGGDEWAIERPPIGTEDFPVDSVGDELLKWNSCFVTSFSSCSKKQVIDLKAEGAIPYFMDKFHPNIVISEWYCGRFDCKSVYELKVTLLDENADALEQFEISKNVGAENGHAWEQVNYVLDEYPPGVRYIEFYHGGTDSQFWAGHYGSKMTGASVILTLP